MVCAFLKDHPQPYVEMLAEHLATQGLGSIDPLREAKLRIRKSIRVQGYAGMQLERLALAKEQRLVGGEDGWACGSGIQACRSCGRVADFLCDEPVGSGKTCDLPICDDCRLSIGPELDLCPIHAGRHPNGRAEQLA